MHDRVSQLNSATTASWFHAPKGQAALLAVLIVFVVLLVTIVGFSLAVSTRLNTAREEARSREAFIVAQAGIEEAMWRIQSFKLVPSSFTLTVGGGTATVTVSAPTPTSRTITSSGSVANAIRRITTAMQLDAATNIPFAYGVHISDGGITMGNSDIIGSVYSNGNITGVAGSFISQDATVAAGADILDANWTVQNADFSFGTSSGSGTVITAVDSAGNVGEYGSLALGSDGFARIGYYDVGNGDLKFARCTNADCTAANITTVESANDFGWRYVSLALGSDGFARMSYYDNSGDNLNYTRCTNDDCTAKNTRALDTAGDVGQFSSLALGSDGFARISYYRISGGDLRMARCTNGDCTAPVITGVDTSNDVGKYTSIIMGSDGFARISYIHETDDDLKFARCTNADCTAAITTVVDGASNINQNTAITLGADGLARISYYDDGSDDLKFARCTNADCTARNIATLDSAGDVGRYSAIRMGGDGFARIAYYDASSGSVKFARCTNADCTGNVIQVVDTVSDVGKYNGLMLGADGFARISYYDEGSNQNLKFARCTTIDCAPAARADAAQSFIPLTTDYFGRVSLYLKKVGTPPDIPVYIVPDEGGRPADSVGEAVASGTLSASAVGASYAWAEIILTTSTQLTAGLTYWVLADGVTDASNYWVWGEDNTDIYPGGSGRYSADWTTGAWSNVGGDLDFRVWRGQTRIESLAIGSVLAGTARAQQFITTTVRGVPCPNVNCIVSVPARLEMPISDATITIWKNDAAVGGTCAPPVCDVAGNYTLANGDAATLGPLKINGNMLIDNLAVLTLRGTIWVTGNVTLSNNCVIQLHPGYGIMSGLIVVDGDVTINNRCLFNGSGDPQSYIMLLDAKDAPASNVMQVDNVTTGVIYYAGKGRVNLKQNAVAKQLTAYGVNMENNAEIIYEPGLVSARFPTGPTGGWLVTSWQETL